LIIILTKLELVCYVGGLHKNRPAFNLALLLRRCGRCAEAADVWLNWRFRGRPHGSAAVCHQLVAEVHNTCPFARWLQRNLWTLNLSLCLLLSQTAAKRSSLLVLPSPESLITSHVPTGLSTSISPIQLCLLDLLLLEYRLGTFC
jgi:hypothetical protein